MNKILTLGFVATMVAGAALTAPQEAKAQFVSVGFGSGSYGGGSYGYGRSRTVTRRVVRRSYGGGPYYGSASRTVYQAPYYANRQPAYRTSRTVYQQPFYGSRRVVTRQPFYGQGRFYSGQRFGGRDRFVDRRVVTRRVLGGDRFDTTGSVVVRSRTFRN